MDPKVLIFEVVWCWKPYTCVCVNIMNIILKVAGQEVNVAEAKCDAPVQLHGVRLLDLSLSGIICGECFYYQYQICIYFYFITFFLLWFYYQYRIFVYYFFYCGFIINIEYITGIYPSPASSVASACFFLYK